MLISGGGGLAGFPVLFSWGVQHTSAGHAAAGTASAAVVAGILTALIDRRWPSPAWSSGIVIGYAGALVLIWETVGFAVEGVTLAGDLLVFAGMATGVVGYIAGARLTVVYGTVATSMWSVVVAAIMLAPVIVWYSDTSVLFEITVPQWGAICSLARAIRSPPRCCGTARLRMAESRASARCNCSSRCPASLPPWRFSTSP